jgi:hypothetical protein
MTNTPDTLSEPIAQSTLHWYRVPLDRAVLAEFNQRSDAWGFAQTLGHLGIIAATGALSWYASLHWGWLALIGCLFLHGTVYAFLLNAFHEFCHNTVFKTRALNKFFLLFVSFIGWLNQTTWKSFCPWKSRSKASSPQHSLIRTASLSASKVGLCSAWVISKTTGNASSFPITNQHVDAN